MKNFTYFVMALLSLVLLPQQMQAQCSFTPNTFPGQEADRTDYEVNAIVHVGEYGSANTRNMIMDLTSSNTDAVVTYSQNGYSASVWFVGVGNANVTYKDSVARQCSSFHTIHYTVEKGTPTISVPAATYTITWSQSGGGGEDGSGSGGDGATTGGSSSGGGVTTGEGGVVTGGGGDVSGGGSSSGGSSSAAPAPSILIKELIVQREIPQGWSSTAVAASELTYNSTNTAVAEIDANGIVTVKGYGETTLSASWPGNANWNAAVASYKLAVKKRANIYFSPSNINDTIDNVRKLNVVCPEGVTIDRWESLSTNVATVDNEGNVTMLKAGMVSIRAYFDGNDEYDAAVCACQITIAKKRPQIHFAQSSIKLELNATPYAFPELIKPADLTNYYSWRSTSTKVATVDNSGNITIVGAGSTQIQYLYDQGETQHDPKYLPEIARLNITVTTSGLYVGGTYVMSANPDIFGDGSVVYSFDNGETNLTLTNLNYDANGGTFIQAVQNVNLNVYVKGNCYITNAVKAIETNGPLYIWCENKKDTIHIDATNTAIQTGAMKVIDCYLFANGGQYGINTNTFAVWAGGYIFAQGNTEAIRSYSFQRGMADMGGIEVLTKGVTFVEGTSGGFFTDYNNKVKAKYVEIGKIPLPLPEDEVTNINFETDNPYDNLDVVFSESKDDQFNEGEKQIEMNTVTTAEDVTNASAAHTTCSSDWLKMLPGVLVFDLPAGKGEVEIECEIKAGSQLMVRVEGKGDVDYTTEDGKIKVEYDNAEQTHVVVYLLDKGSSPAPKRIAQATKDTEPGAAIKSIKITPKGAPTAIQSATADQFVIKRIVDGQLLIERDGRTYNASGIQVK